MPIAAPAAVPLPKEIEAAAEQLPHLAAETVQLVMSRSEFGPLEPPEVLRRAQAAADQGRSALTEDEAQELAALRSAVLAPLRRADRDRVRAYDRVHTGRELMPGEDAKVLGLVARGARALPPPRRERLRALLGKAVAAGLGPPARPPAP